MGARVPPTPRPLEVAPAALLDPQTGNRCDDRPGSSLHQYEGSREGAENATINRELSLLKRAFNLAREGTPPKVRVGAHTSHAQGIECSQRFRRMGTVRPPGG